MFRVIWTAGAEQDLAAAWIAAPDREAVAASSYGLDQLLADNPFSVGESRESSVTRITALPPLGMLFDIIADDMKVFVRNVWLIR